MIVQRPHLRLARIVRGVAILLARRDPVTFQLSEESLPVDCAWLLEKLAFKLEEPKPTLHPPVEQDLEDYI
jgi:hypothetical protein